MYGLKGEKIWIDDIRTAPEDFRHCKTYTEAIAAIDYFALCEGGIDIICFDHDIQCNKNGYDIAKYIVENNIKIGAFSVQSKNPVGANNIRQLLTHYGYKEVYLDYE